ncbi:MAG: hypothetical protein DMF50_04610 [Acidobacteria bacterium]|nr:MAG: hypothetical protein DMF50_04610 [Acidobacteriota bacterium]
MGPESSDVANQLNDLGLYHYYLGDFEESRRLQERALKIREKTFGPDDTLVAASLNNLALLLTNLGDSASARPLAERAVAIYEKSKRPGDPNLPIAVNTLATLRRNTGDFEGARQLYERDIDLWQAIGGADPPGVSVDLNDYAEMLLGRGDLEGARPRFERALDIREKRLGAEHPDVAVTLSGLARLQMLSGDRAAALESALRSEAIARKQFRATARGLSEREALNYERIRSSGLDVALSALVATPGAERAAGMAAQIWDELVRSRGMVLDEMALRHRTATSGEHSRAAAPARELEQARNRLARVVVEGPEGADPGEYAARLVRAREEKESAERALAAVSAAFRRELAEGRLGLRDVRNALPPRTALVAYVLYTELAPSGTREVPSYLALVLRPDGSEPDVVPLGPASGIEALVRDWRQEVARPPKGLAGAGGEGEERYRTVAAPLKRAVWDPVARHLAGAGTVLVVPDGVLNLVSLATLPSDGGRYLVEDGPLLHYLSSERAAVRPAAVRKAGRGLLAVGGVDFDARLIEAAAPASGAGRPGAFRDRALPASAGSAGPEVPVAQGVRQATCAGFRSLRFAPLPDSRAEVEEIESLWKRRPAAGSGGPETVLKLMGPRADKETFKKSVAGRRVVHLATHGFFAQDRCPSALERARGQAPGRDGAGPGTGPGDDPLLLSGLALAGANRRQETGEEGDDGLLTAEEIASLDLSGVEWAVLSACETGVGTVQVGEGVLGLRRAFEIAGADTLILSLWSVEDASAREWMRALYGARLSGRSTAEAVRRASREMIDARRRAGRSTHPASWGAFVATGDWR